jgi:hypothetical protein
MTASKSSGRSVTRRSKTLSTVGALLAVALLATMTAGCETLKTSTTDATCEAIKRSPKYSGKKIEAAAGKPFRHWVATTNLTLDRLDCPGQK